MLSTLTLSITPQFGPQVRGAGSRTGSTRSNRRRSRCHIRRRRPTRPDQLAHVEIAARMTGDRDLAASHQLYFGLGHVNRMTVNDIALHQTEIIEPEYRRHSVPPQSIGLLHRRL